MIEPLQASLVSAVLECINQDRIGNGHLVNAEIVRGVIESFVTVNKFKKRDNIEVSAIFNARSDVIFQRIDIDVFGIDAR